METNCVVTSGKGPYQFEVYHDGNMAATGQYVQISDAVLGVLTYQGDDGVPLITCSFRFHHDITAGGVGTGVVATYWGDNSEIVMYDHSAALIAYIDKVLKGEVE